MMDLPESQRTDQISVLKVKAVKLVAGLLRIHYILVDHESRSLGRIRDSLADLAAVTVSTKIMM